MNKITKIIIIFLCLLFMIAAILPFFNTGLILKVSPKETIITINGEAMSEKDIKLKSGIYHVVASLWGYESFEKNIKVGVYGKKNLEINLVKKTLIKEVPYSPDKEGLSFFIKGVYNEKGEPVYEIHYATGSDKKAALSWLEEQNITPTNDNILYVIDGG